MNELPDLATWLAEWATLWGVPELPGKVSVVPGRRLRRSLGRCHPGTGRVQLHPELLATPGDLLREVVCHEAAHAATHLLHGKGRRPHGPEWARLMRLAGFAPRARIAAGALPPDLQAAVRPKRLYRHRCPACGTTRMAGRAVPRWRCRTCFEAGRGGRLEITGVDCAGPR